MKTAALSILVLFAMSSVACGGAVTASQSAAATPIEVNAADWTPPGEEQMVLPDAPAVAHRESAQTTTTGMRPTVFSEGKKGSLVVLPTKRAN